MAKGKNNKKPKSITPSGDQDGEAISTTETAPDLEADPEASECSPSPKAAEQEQSEPSASADSSGGVDSAKEQLQAALDEISSLKLALADRDAEIVSLKACAIPSAASTAQSDDLQRLTERLAVLKKEQAEADAARETAWRQLKSVVGEITKLAVTPETATGSASNPSTPGAANGLTMGRSVTASS